MTKIEWTDETWNPIAGCNDVSEGCRNCYARTMAGRLEAMGVAKYAGLTVLQGSHRVWTGEIGFDEKALLAPLARKKPTRYFVNSMSDLFHENVTDAMRDRIFAVMALCPQHTFQVLTKRPDRALAYLSDPIRQKLVARACIDPENGYPIHGGYFSCDEPGNLNLYEVFWKNCRLYFKDEEGLIREAHDEARWMQFVAAYFRWPLANVWLGVSVEDQKTADERIPLLLKAPAAMRFISAEPLLGPIDLTNVMERRRPKGLKINSIEGKEANPAHAYLVKALGADYPYARLEWVIVGGESGRGARPMHPDWARSLRDQCVAAGVRFFFKQWGEYQCVEIDPERIVDHLSCINSDGQACALSHAAGEHWYNLGDDIGFWKQTGIPSGYVEPRRVGKKAAGHLLDGKEWHQFPAVTR